MRADLFEKLKQTRAAIESCFFHRAYYIDLALAEFVAGASSLWEGTCGTGKTHLCRTIIKTVDPEITGSQQGYLSADFEVLASPNLAKLMQGDEVVKWRKVVKARVKFFDELQRLGPNAKTGLFKLLDDGTVEFFDQEEGTDRFMVLATANPTERAEDTLNVDIPPPLWDRFMAAMWLPMTSHANLSKIRNGSVKKAYDAIPIIWHEQDLLDLWEDCRNISLDPTIDEVMTLMLRIPSFCVKTQDYDAGYLDEQKKRTACSECQAGYLCSQVLRPPSVRAKEAFERLAKGFAYVNGRERVTMADLKAAFIPVLWKRIVFMDEATTYNRFTRLEQFYEKIETEIKECKELIDLVVSLKQQYDTDKMRRLEEFGNAKIWTTETVNEVKQYHEDLKKQLAERQAQAKTKKDSKALKQISQLARQLLPPDDAKALYFKDSETISLDPKTLAKLADIDPKLFKRAEREYYKGTRKLELTEEETEAYREAAGKHDA